MTTRFRLPMSLILILLLPAAVLADIDLEQSSIGTRARQGVFIMICPACDGDMLSWARLPDGGNEDATIEVYLKDTNGNPIANFPFEDIWLEAPGLCFCPGLNVPDFNTDAFGYTQFAFSLCGGGCMHIPSLWGYVNGEPFHQNPIPHITVNSPDMNCSLTVDLVDVSMFAAAFYSAYSYCADFNGDGLLNLVDLGILASHIGHRCPGK
jgi:hypothetical protein